MNNLYQKFHGLPGVGIRGKKGQTGVDGKSLYMGFINDFFDYDEVAIEGDVKIARRHINTSEGTLTTEAVSHYLMDAYNYAKHVLNSSSVLLYDYLNTVAKNTSVYYSGVQVTPDIIDTMKQARGILGDYGRYNIDINNNVMSMLSMLTDTSLLDFEQYKFININQVQLDIDGSTYSYVNVYDYVDPNAYKLGSNNTVVVSTLNITYEPEDAAMKMNRYVDFTPYNKATLNSSTFYTMLDGNAQPINASLEDPVFVKESVYDASAVTTYATGTRDYYYDFDTSKYIYYNYGHINQQSEGAFKKITMDYKITDPLYTDEEFYTIDSDGRRHYQYALDASLLYTSTDQSTGDYILNSASNITSYLYSKNSQLYNPASYVKTLINDITLCVRPLQSLTDTINIRWIAGEDGVIRVPTRLKDTYKSGDILYFYLDDTYLGDKSPRYMIILTDNLLQCDINTLISHATIENPLEIKYLFDENNRVYAANKTITLFKGNDTTSNAFSYNSMNNIIDNCYDTAAIITTTDDDADYVYMDASCDGETHAFVLGSSDNSPLMDVSMIKLDSFLVKTEQAHYCNIELYDTVYDNVKLSNGFIDSLSTIDAYIVGTDLYLGKLLNASDFFTVYDSSCMYGYEVYSSVDNAQLLESKSTTSDTMQILLDTLSPVNISHITGTLSSYVYIMLFAVYGNGMKHCSKMSRLDYTVTDGVLMDYKIALVDDYVSIETAEREHCVNFMTSNITSEKNSGIFVISPMDGSTHLTGEIYFNRTDTDRFRNSWIDVSLNDKTNETYTFVYDMSTNLPKIITVNPPNETDETLTNETVAEYMSSLSEDAYGESQLFYNIRNGVRLPSTQNRSLQVTVGYTKDFENNSMVYYDSFDMIQPGFTDKRDIPDITIDMHNDFNELEAINKYANGILCNQFVTYMDVKIEGMWDKWGQFADNSTNISLDFTLKNINSDIDWTSKYNVQKIVTRSTLKLFGDEKCLMNGNRYEPLNNYVSIDLKPVSDSNDVISYDYLSVNSTITLQSREEDVDMVYEPIIVDDASVSYIFLDSSILDYTSVPNIMYHGINDTFEIKFTGMTLKDIQKHPYVRFRVSYEMGNPVLSNLYLRFALQDVKIHYDTYIGDVPHSVTFSTTVPEKVQDASSYLYSNANNLEQYKVISNALDITTNPLSYVICPLKNEVGMNDMTGTVVKTGSGQMITKGLEFYEKQYYEVPALFSTVADGSMTAAQIRQSAIYVWDAMKLKYKYLQDNISNIDVQLHDFDITKYDDAHVNRISTNTNMLIDGYIPNDYTDSHRYTSIVYNASIMAPTLRNGTHTFYYKDSSQSPKELAASKYHQFKNGVPDFQTQTMQMEVRNSDMLDAVNVWNFEYQNGTRHSTDYVFRGNTNEYGNGYAYLDAAADTSQYADQQILPLADVVSYNNRYMYNDIAYKDIDTTSNIIAGPDYKGFYRTFLYDINWEYPHYTGQSIYPVQFVSDFDYLIEYMRRSNMTIPAEYEPKNASLNEKNPNMLPYNTVFELTPRIACNTDTKTINVLMLRRPSIGTDCDDMTDFDTCYNLHRHYFELMEGQEFRHLDIPYNL